MDRIKVRRVIEIEGPKDWVETTLAKSICSRALDYRPPNTGVIRELSREQVSDAQASPTDYSTVTAEDLDARVDWGGF